MSAAPPFRLDGKVALVTGASRGIGRGIARVFAQAGADVALAATNEKLLNEVAGEIEGLGRRALALRVDLSDPAAARGLPARVHSEWGRLDILVNNAGIAAKEPLEEITEQSWDDILAINLKATFLITQAAAPYLRASGAGRVINISSVAAQTGGVAGSGAYSASKAGMHGFTKSAARDLADSGVTVNAIAPGQILTDMGRLTPEMEAKIVGMIPLGRLGVPEDIAYAALYLASEEAGYMTGAVMDVNGGILKR